RPPTWRRSTAWARPTRPWASPRRPRCTTAPRARPTPTTYPPSPRSTGSPARSTDARRRRRPAMIEPAAFAVFFAAAFVLAVVPGPGMLYVLARTLKGGRREGLLSTAGTALAGMVHTVAAALGLSAVLATSAT